MDEIYKVEQQRAEERINARLAQNVFAARSANEMTQADLADRSRCSRATIAELEAGQGNPTISTLSNIALALNTSVLLLLIGEEELQVLSMVAAGIDDVEGFSSDQLPQLGAALAEMERLKSSPLPNARRKLALSAARAVSQASKKATAAMVGAAIGSFVLPGFGTALGAALGAATTKKET